MELMILFGIFLFFSIGSISLLIITGIFILVKSIINKMINTLLLAISFFSVAFGFIGNLFFNLGELGGPLQEYFIFIGFITFVIFINTTFYKKQMKIGWVILIIVVVLGINQIVMHHLFLDVAIKRGFPYFLRVSLDFPYIFIVFNWLTYSCFKAYKQLKKHDIQAWIKARYVLLAISSFILSFHNIPEFFQPKDILWVRPSNPLSLLLFGITTSLMMFYAIIVSLSWFMPRSLKRFFNRNYSRDLEEDFTEEELMKQFKIQFEGC